MWHEFRVRFNGKLYWATAKVFEDLDIIKMSICDGKIWDVNKEIYCFDRGLQKNHVPQELVDKVKEKAITLTKKRLKY